MFSNKNIQKTHNFPLMFMKILQKGIVIDEIKVSKNILNRKNSKKGEKTYIKYGYQTTIEHSQGSTTSGCALCG